MVGAVRNQITIELNQKPIRLIEAAIKANFNPSSADKLYGTKGLLRRDNKVYKINLTNNLEFPSKARWPLDSNAPFLKGPGIRL